MNGLSIGKLARAARVSVDTVRLYERKGLIASPPRSEAGYEALFAVVLSDGREPRIDWTALTQLLAAADALTAPGRVAH